MTAARIFAGVCFCIRSVIVLLSIISMVLILTAPGACFTRYLNGQPISREICPGQNSIFPMNADRWSNGLHFQGKGQNVYGQVALIVISLVLSLATLGFSCVHLAIGTPMTIPGFLSAVWKPNMTKRVRGCGPLGRLPRTYARRPRCCPASPQQPIPSTTKSSASRLDESRSTPRNAVICKHSQVAASSFCLIAFLVLGGVETWYATGFDHIAFFIQAIGNGVFSGCAGLPGCQVDFVVKGWAVAAAFFFLSAVLYLVDIIVVLMRRDKGNSHNYFVSRPMHY